MTEETGSEGTGSAGPARVAPGVIGVVGAGTMGAGIAQLASRFAVTLLHDPVADALQRGLDRAKAGLAKEAEKGILSAERAAAAQGRLRAAADLAEMAECELVIEAAPERPDLKREIFERLCEVVSAECVLATNTSSLPVTGVAAAASHPERVVGMHFFNPAPLMRLVEVIAGVRSGERALAVASAAGEAMGKTVIRASDGPGFLVNRCNRPFGLEALRMLSEQISDIETIDRICRLAGGFRMGPFELSDLVGVDVGFEVSLSFHELSYGEPRWRPSPLQARQVAAGLHGRKSGRGWYPYPEGAPARAADPEPPAAAAPAQGEGVVVITGDGSLAGQLRQATADAGSEVRDAERQDGGGGEPPALIVRCELRGAGAAGARRERGAGEPPAAIDGDAAHGGRPHGAPELILCAAGSLAALDAGGGAAGFHVVGPLEECRLVELTRTGRTSPIAAERAERFFATLGLHIAWVGDAPGLVLGRIVCQLVNECAFALGERVGTAQDIDRGMVLGLNHPRGPLAWADQIGLDHVLAVLDALSDHYREERYRAAPLLRRLVLEGRLGRASGAGFFEY